MSTRVLPTAGFAIEKVPMKENAADRFIERHIASGDIVLIDDTNLTAKCLNKGALAIDYWGRVLGPSPESGMIGRKGVQRMKQKSSTGRKKKSRENDVSRQTHA